MKFIFPTLFLICALIFPTRAATFIVDNQNPRALDSNSGTRELPFKTINAAVQKAGAGDEVLVRPGTYREAITVVNSGKPGAPLIIRSETPREAIISGSNIITDWKLESPGVWSMAAPNLVEFSKGGRRGNGDWIYIDGFPLEETIERGRLAPGAFFRDSELKRIFVAPESGDINSLKVEYSTRESLLRGARMLDDIHVIGFTVIHSAGQSATGGQGRRWLWENNHILWASYRGLTTTRTNGAIVRGNLIEWCGNAAIGGGQNMNLTVENNKFLFNNWRRIDPNFEGGASKWTFMLNGRIRGNESAFNFGYGLWTDIHNYGNIFENNLSHDEIGGGSIFSEISSGDIIRDNIVYNCNQGIIIGESPATLVQRNICFNNSTGIRMRGDFRRLNANIWTNAVNGLGPDTFETYEKTISEIPDISATEVEQHMARYLLYWRAPRFHMSNNSYLEGNILFDNALNYWEHRNYGAPSALDSFINNFSDYNIFFNARADRHVAFAGGYYPDFETWKKVSGRDANSINADPRDAKTVLPEWAKAKRALWDKKLRPAGEIQNMNLGLVDSPSAAQMRGRIIGSPLLQMMSMKDARIKACVLEVDGQRALALWTTQVGEKRVARFGSEGKNLVFENPFGGKTTRAAANGIFEIAVGFLPQLVRGVGAKLVELPTSTLASRAYNLSGQPIPVEAKFVNSSSQPQKLSATFAANSGYRATPATIERLLPAGQTVTIPVSLAPDGSFARGLNAIRLDATLGDEKITRVAAFSVGEGGGRVLLMARAPLIDGQISEWTATGETAFLAGEINGAEQIVNGDKTKWKNADDLSAKIYTAWDEDFFYAAVAVRDDVVIPTPANAFAYEHDSVELFIDGRAPEMQWQTAPTEGVFQMISAAPDAAGKTAPISILSKSPLQGAVSTAAQRAGGYVVEWKIPLSDANFPAGEWRAGRPLKLSVLVNDKDDAGLPGREYSSGWSASPGASNSTSTSGWKTLVLE